MAMPNRLVFVRHGQSEANVTQKANKEGWKHPLHDVVNARPDWEQRLTPLGVEQATLAGEWIRRNLGGVASFDFRYYSPFLRTRETAGYITGDEEAEWRPDNRIIERSWGHFGVLSEEERAEMYPLTKKMYEQSPWYTKLDNGESREDISVRWWIHQNRLHENAAGKRVISVTHGDFIGVARYNLENMLPEHFAEMEADVTQNTGNCYIFDYSREDPSNPDKIEDHIVWRRITNPIDTSKSPFDGEWIKLPRKREYTAAELISSAERIPRLIPDEMYNIPH